MMPPPANEPTLHEVLVDEAMERFTAALDGLPTEKVAYVIYATLLMIYRDAERKEIDDIAVGVVEYLCRAQTEKPQLKSAFDWAALFRRVNEVVTPTDNAAQSPTCWQDEGLGDIVTELRGLATERPTIDSARILIIVRRIDQWCQRDMEQLKSVTESYRTLMEAMRKDR